MGFEALASLVSQRKICVKLNLKTELPIKFSRFTSETIFCQNHESPFCNRIFFDTDFNSIFFENLRIDPLRLPLFAPEADGPVETGSDPQISKFVFKKMYFFKKKHFISIGDFSTGSTIQQKHLCPFCMKKVP